MESPPTATRVLVLEDDPDVAELAERLLREALSGGCVVDHQVSAARALASAQRKPPALVLLDIQLAQGDGFEFLKSFRAVPSMAAIPVIMMTAQEPDQAMARSFAAGAVDYLTKPLRQGELAARVARALGPRGLR